MTDPHRPQDETHRADPWSSPPVPVPPQQPVPVPSQQRVPDRPQQSSEESTSQQAKNAAGDVAHDAQDAGRAVADTARSEAAGVKDDAVREGRKLWDETTSTLGTQASDQLHRAAGTMRTFSDDLGRMSRGEQPEEGLAKDLAGQVTERTDAIAGWLENHEPADVLTEVKSFARRRPVAFLAIAAGVGFAAGRLTRSVAQSHSDDNGSEGQTSHRALVEHPSPDAATLRGAGRQYSYSPTGEVPPPPGGGTAVSPPVSGAPVPGGPQPISPDATPVTSVPPQPPTRPPQPQPGAAFPEPPQPPGHRATDPYGRGGDR